MPSQIWDWHSFHKEISTDLPNVVCAGMYCSSILICGYPHCSSTCFDLFMSAMLAFVWICCCIIAMDKAAISIVTLLTSVYSYIVPYTHPKSYILLAITRSRL